MTLKQITAKLSRATHSWEVEDELLTLWSLGDQGDLEAFTLYGLALLMEGKGWYDLEEGRLALENAAEEGCAMAQYYLGRFLLDARDDHDADSVMGRYWLRKAAENGYVAAEAYLRKKWGD